MATQAVRCYLLEMMSRTQLSVAAGTLVVLVLLTSPPALAGEGGGSDSSAPRFAVLIDPLQALAVLYSGVITVRPQFQWAAARYFALEASGFFMFASSRFENVDDDVLGGGALVGVRIVMDYLGGPYLACRTGPLTLQSDDLQRTIMLVEAELGWSWAPRKRGLVMNGGLGYQGYHPLDAESRLHYVAAHTLLVNYSLGYAW